MKGMEQIFREQTKNTRKIVTSLFWDAKKTEKGKELYGYIEDGIEHVVVFLPIDTVTNMELKNVEKAGFRVGQIAFADGLMRLDLERFN